jgi:omega-6 fatty acid desaturase (delta-12 desaturase)
MSSFSKLCAPDSDRVLRQQLRPLRGKSTGWALTIVGIDLTCYLACVAIAIRNANSWVGVVFGALAGVGTGALFLVGHDACHGSFTKSPRLNAWLGRIVFLPSLTPFSSSETGHNHTHHQYTNLKTRDYVWAPFSKAEYDRLPAWRRTLERIYRSAPGVGLYYAIEIWWKHLFCPGGVATRKQAADITLCVSVAACAIAVVGSGYGWKAMVTGLAFPFAIWNWLMGWAIFEHHTHPSVPWFDDERKWRAGRTQSMFTVHMVLPRPLDVLFHEIFHHTAHHLDVTIPLYRLRRAQSAVEAASGGGLIVEHWTPMRFIERLRHCRLYDFENQLWLDFDGTPSFR